MEYMTFPWEQLGILLRRLSLSGGIGNAAAWICYLVIGGVPLGGTVWMLARHKACRADILLPILSALIYMGLWFLVNPSYLNIYLFPTELGNFGKYALTAVMDGLLLSWILLKCISGFEKLGKKRLFRSLGILLGIYVAMLSLMVLWQGGVGFVAACIELMEKNTGAQNMVPVSCLFLGLQTLAEYLPRILELVLYCMVLDLLHSCEKEIFGAESYGKVERLKKYSSRFLGAIVLTNLGVNMLQLLFARFLLSSHYAIVFPLWEIIVVLGIGVLSRFYLESRQLKEDNDLFI